jgi:hypothetical protein
VSKNISLLFTTLLFLNSCFNLYAQERCGTVEYTRQLKSLNLLHEDESQFEQWLKRKKENHRVSSTLRKKAGPYKIPVVVHVIHNGEPEGSGTNVSDEQIFSQIKVLNDDFQRNNQDAVNTPAEFAAFAGSMDVEFVLAKRSPDGERTNGIIRIQGSQSGWTINDQYELKAQSYWPSEDYLNIWVCNLTDYLGFAQFPESDLPGLSNSSENRFTDGLMVWYRSFGSIDDGNFDLDPDYNKGRTVTHEISHFFGLRHIWGDIDGCNGDDYVADTPTQDGFTSGCPAHPRVECANTNTMFQNFTDYTDDACMNLFTQLQVDRMEIVLENSPRRKTLIVSPGLLAPDPVANDLGLRKVVSPELTQCSNVVFPEIEVKNYGTNTIISTRIRLKVNGIAVAPKDVTLNLSPGDSTTIVFNSFVASTGTTNLTFEIALTNGLQDGDPVGNENTITSTVDVPAIINLPFQEDFSLLSADWIIRNPDSQTTWESILVPDGNENNQAIALKFFDYADNIGELDILYTPVFDLSSADSAFVLFDVAHAMFENKTDQLKLVVITDCQDISEGTVIYDKSGEDLATVQATDSYFVPNSANDWRTEMLSLKEFTTSQFVQLAFIGINANGNNLYLDNISVATEINDVSLKEIIAPSLVTCSVDRAYFVVQNLGSTIIHELVIDHSINGEVQPSNVFGAMEFLPGQTLYISLGVNFTERENILTVTLGNPNNLIDQNLANNARSIKVIINDEQDRIPQRINFDESFNKWTIANPGGGMNWETILTDETTTTKYKNALFYNAYNNLNIGDESWFVSPVLDFSEATAASMIFDISYRSALRKDQFKILVSQDCGVTYQNLGYNLHHEETDIDSWKPEIEDDWLNDEYLDLSIVAGKTDVRIAFVVTNANGNNLYLDNVEFFVNRDPRDVSVDVGYSIFGYNLENMAASTLKIGFNLENRQDVECHITDTMGKLIAAVRWTDVLNQVFDLPFDGSQSAGAYIVRVNAGGEYSSRLVYLVK